MPAGRPSGYERKFARRAAALAKRGADNATIADAFGVNIRTINRWMADNDEFRRAIKADRAVADDNVERSLYQRAIGYYYDATKIVVDKKTGKSIVVPYREHVPPDVTAQIFWLKNRRPDEWRDQRNVALTAEVRNVQTIDDLKAFAVKELGEQLAMRVLGALDSGQDMKTIEGLSGDYPDKPTTG